MNSDKYLNKAINDLNPEKLREDSIKNEVFNRLNLEKPTKTAFNLFDLSLMQKKLIYSTLTLGVLGVFIGLPLLSAGYKRTNSLQFGAALEGDLQISAPQSTSTSENFVGKIAESIGMMQERLIVSDEVENEDTKTKENDRAKDKDAELSIRVEDINQTVDAIYELTSTVEGYVVSSNASVNTKTGSGYLTIRVPSDKFDFTIREFRSLAVEVLSENTSIVDIQNDLSQNEDTLIELMQDLEELMAQMDSATSEVEKSGLESEIKRVENQIKIYEQQIQELEERASYSTISISLTQRVETGEEHGGISSIWERALEQAKTIGLFWTKIGIWLGVVFPAIILPVILTLLAYKVVKKLRK